MRLELHWSQVETLTAGATTRLAEKALTVDLDELQALLEADARLQRIRLDLAAPGDSCRIGRVVDVMGPRARLGGGENFPGALGSTCPVWPMSSKSTPTWPHTRQFPLPPGRS